MYSFKKKKIVFLFLFLYFSCIKTQRDIQMEKELGELKLAQSSLKKEFSKTDYSLRSRDVKKAQTLDDIQTELQILSGKIDEVTYKTEQKFNTRLLHLELEIKKIQEELKTAKLSSAAVPAASSEDKKLSQKDLYNRAYGLFTNKKYSKAIIDFKLLLKRFPKTSYGENAHFFIASSYFNLNKCEDAILAYEEVIKRYPKSKRTAVINLKQGICFSKLGAKEDAKYFFNQVVQKNPKSSEAKKAKKHLKEFKK